MKNGLTEYDNGHKEYWWNDKFHREDGPAVITCNGDKYWFIDGTQYLEYEYNIIIGEFRSKKIVDDIDEMFDRIEL